MAITRNNVILAQCTFNADDYDVIVSEILSKVDLQNTRIQFDRNEHRFFILHNQNGLNSIVSTDTTFDSSLAFVILEDIARAFMASYSASLPTAEAFSLQQDFEAQMKQIALTRCQQAKVEKIQNNVEETKEVMMDALEKAILRGNNLDDMGQKTDSISEKAAVFRRTSNTLKIRLFIRKYIYVFIGIFVLLLVLSLLIFLIVQ